MYGRHDWRLKGAQARVGRGARGGGGGGGWGWGGWEREKEREVKKGKENNYMHVYMLGGRALCLECRVSWV